MARIEAERFSCLDKTEILLHGLTQYVDLGDRLGSIRRNFGKIGENIEG